MTTNDTQAPDTIWVVRTGIEGAVEVGSWADTVRYHGGTEYVSATVAAAQTAAAWMAGRDAAVEHQDCGCKADGSDCLRNDGSIPICYRDGLADVRDITPPAAASAALDALIAERVNAALKLLDPLIEKRVQLERRAAVEAEREACAHEADQTAQEAHSFTDPVGVAVAFRLASIIRARASKEGRDG